jgi:tetratricopeptide (TPR) repeat protein
MSDALPPDVLSLRREVEAHARARRFPEAIAACQRLLDLEPGLIWALDMLGFVSYMDGRFAAARAACEQALAIDPDHAYAEKGLGLCLVRLGEPDAGIQHLERSIALAPRWFDVRHDLGVTLLELGRLAEARVVLEAARGVEPGRAVEVDRLLRAVASRETAGSA